ncbi:MAG: hypothetical protein ACE10H_12515, partial [Candidatus Binatia bacterium]
AKKNSSYFSELGVLCAFAARPVEYPFHRSVIFSFTALFHGARPVEYLLDRKYIGFAVKLFHRASHRLSDSLYPNSTEKFKYVWLEFGI